MGVSQKIIRIIIDNNISISDISCHTGISEERLMDINTVFSAEEFLKLCSYLHLEPRNMKD